MARTTQPTRTRPVTASANTQEASTKTKAKSAARDAKRNVEDAAQTAKSAAYAAADGVTDQAARLADDAIATGRRTADDYVQYGASRTEAVIRTVGRAIDAASQSLEDDGMRATAGYVRAAATGLQRAADEVDEFEPGAVTGRVESFVRSQPMVTMGALALAGFVLAGSLSKRRS